MTTEIEALETNEFLRRRKLRLQQVREQSKDIAKKIRQRAKGEKLRQVAELDSKKEQEYLQRQEKLVKRLEILYAKGVKNIGSGHKQAADLTQGSPEKPDLSKQRGREAVAELRKRKQELLDEQKKLLDRKLQAREVANEISREKSTNVANKILTKTSSVTVNEQPKENCLEEANDVQNNTENEVVKQIDMATQWEFNVLPNEWEPTIPALSLPKDDSEKESLNINNTDSKSDKSKRVDLFALSEEMPSSLRGGLTNIPEERVTVKPSFTLVSEYLQNRGLRLREPDNIASKPPGDLHSIKQTIMRTRPSKNEVKGKSREKSPISSVSSMMAKKNSVTIYNHLTRDSRQIPCGEERLVVHNTNKDEDAYSQAVKESSSNDAKEKEHQHKLQEMRSKIAMTKQNVEKEYNDTLSFLNSLPKEKGSKTVKTAYMDERREKMLKDSRQQKLQQEYRKIEKECRKHGSTNSRRCSSENRRHKSKSPENVNIEEQDCQYSWMPVPESDGSLAIHTIPTTKPKSGNSVKFSKVDSYHEYRSRHKHTPPTKEKEQETLKSVLIQDGSESSDSSSDTSSIENMGLGSSTSKNKTKKQHDKELTDAERIIIYKVLESKKKEKAKKKAKLISDIAKSLHSINRNKSSNEDTNGSQNSKEQLKGNTVSFEHVQEGIYKTTKEKGDNLASLYFTENSGAGRAISLSRDEILYGKPCDCNFLDKEQQRDTGTNIHMGKGDRVLLDREPKKCKCGCGPQPVEHPVPPAPQPSAATSTSSFKTASNDKECPAFPEGGFVKLLDNEGQEAGKFYIGASGFLKDDDYEVIIQLRKKDSAKEEKKSDKNEEAKLYTIKEAQQNEEATAVRTSENIADSKQEVPVSVSSRHEPVDVAEEAVQATPNTLTKDEICETRKTIEDLPINKLERVISGSNISDIEEAQINCTDKCVCTSFQLSYAVPSQMTISDPIANPKAATSTYTQTTFNSTNTRPAYIHMSSSTSTAYMSPPEVVLPRFLRRDSDEDTHKAFNTEFGRFEKHYQNCTCKNCFIRKTNLDECNPPCKKKSRCSKANIPTPPNTCRSYNSSTSEKPFDDVSTNSKNKPRKCRKYECHTDSGKCRKNHEHKSTKNTSAKKKLVLPKHTVPSVASSSRHTWNLKIKDNNSNFNPLIKNYVNKLLTLNREGIKALEVASQECSSVATPGSSIIDVPRNITKQRTFVQPKLSLEQIKNELIKKILTDYVNKTQTEEMGSSKHEQKHIHIKVSASRLPKKRSVHKVKSLNISKRLQKTKRGSAVKKSIGTEESNKNDTVPTLVQQGPSVDVKLLSSKEKFRSKSSPTPRQPVCSEYKRKSSASDIVTTKCSKIPAQNDLIPKQQQIQNCGNKTNKSFALPQHRASSATLDGAPENFKQYEDTSVITQKQEVPITISTQTSHDVDSDINYVKLAENKLDNMEKIADLTEKCTQRLSNLAKVLEEVRKSKSLAYSQISSSSDSACDGDQRSDKNLNSGQSMDIIDVEGKFDFKPSTPALTSGSDENETLESSKYISFLTDIPKPLFTKSVHSETEVAVQNTENNMPKTRTKPPPALSRMHLRHVQGITPHELSTVVEVDSPMSVRLKNQSSRTDYKGDMQDSVGKNSNTKNFGSSNIDNNNEENITNPDLLQSNLSLSKTKVQQTKQTTESSDDSKLQMMDIKQFNEIMLQPFISIQDYAKQYDIGTLDEASNLGDVLKDDIVNEDLSSMQSDGSLPDVIAELLKRKVITEPFKFDTVSNIHSTTGSSESSILALTKVRKDKKKSTVMFHEKENVAESSDTLSFSSNPDLENAFKKLGMGWASSTLKKTKERLALSSSSNTSSSSVSQYKIKTFNNQDIPALVTDSVSTIMQLTKKEGRQESKNNGQQTNLGKSMTVREFLTNELADKITFTNKSRRNDTEEEFVSLFETKMPEEMKHSSQMVNEERSMDSGPGNRARTSTPVQIFKSITYHSSSSSNLSNGLFSNADDLSSVKVTSNSIRNHSTSDKDDLTIPNCSLRIKKASDASKSD